MSSKPSSSPSSNHPPIGTVIDDGSLELVEVLGVGGYGIVYRAEDTFSSSPKSYAVKCLSHPYTQSTRQRQLHMREITLHQIASAHPNVVSLYRVVEEHRHMFIIMEYAPDHDLFSQILHSCRYLGQDHLIRHVFLQLLDAVEYCHSLGIFHRDLKPENILAFDHGLRVALTDFGLATTDKVSSEFRTGSVYHMSPECQGGEFAISGTYSPMANDVWSLGIILLNLATGRNPWKSATMSDPTFQAYLRDPLHFLPTVLPISEELNVVLVRMLAVDWTQRMSLQELRQTMDDVTTFYCEDAVFEGSMARCSWEAEMDIDSEEASAPAQSEHRQQASRWSSDTDSDIVFASPTAAVESGYSHVLQEEASCRAMWTESASDTRSLFVRQQTPESPHSPISPCTSGSVYSFPSTPNSFETTFADKAKVSSPAQGRLPLTINTDFSCTDYYGHNLSMTSYLTESSVMQTAVDYEPYDSSFFFANNTPSKLSIAMPESVILNASYSSDKDMSSPSVSARDLSQDSCYSSTRSFFEVATEGRDDASVKLHVHPQRISVRRSSSTSSLDEMQRISLAPPKQFKFLRNRTKTLILDLFPRSRSPSPPPCSKRVDASSTPREPFTTFSFQHTSTDSPPVETWPGIALPKPTRADARQTCGPASHIRSRPWFLPGKLFTSMGA